MLQILLIYTNIYKLKTWYIRGKALPEGVNYKCTYLNVGKNVAKSMVINKLFPDITFEYFDYLFNKIYQVIIKIISELTSPIAKFK